MGFAVGHGARFAVIQGHPEGPRVFFENPCKTSCWLSIESTALNCIVFEKIVFF